MPLEMVSRALWRGVKHPKQYYPVQTPAPYVFLGHSGTQRCHDLDQCRRQLALLQSRMGKLSPRADIVYNFLVSDEGVVYEARGWRSRACYPGRYEKNFVHCSYYIGLIGNFAEEPPTTAMRRGLHELFYYGAMNHFIDVHFSLLTLNVRVDYFTKLEEELMETRTPDW